MTQLPKGPPHVLRRIQYDFYKDGNDEPREEVLKQRREAVRDATIKCWRTYREFAFGRDELMPQSLIGFDSFSGWGATLVDSLDTLWIMGLHREFKEAVQAVGRIDWNNTEARACSLFETNIRYLGGLLAAYDLSQDEILIRKASELGEMLYAAFDTPNHFPANSFQFDKASRGELEADKHEASATVGSLSMEFTRLSQLTGNPKYFSAIDKVKRELKRTQELTKLPGIWPAFLDLKNGFLTPGTYFTIGAMADSAYEYLSKMFVLLGGCDVIYEKLHVGAMETIKKHMLFRPMVPEPSPDILFAGTVSSNGAIVERDPEVQHLGCFAGGMFALGGRLFDRQEDVEIGEKLARGCAWAYDAFPTGVMPEHAELIDCGTPDLSPCQWNETRWRNKHPEQSGKLPEGFAMVRSPEYHLRPEAIESVFILYRITGKKDLQDTAWRMFESIMQATETKFANSAINDVRVQGRTEKTDSMESFWIAETLKYFYLIFSDPSLISLDDWVLNTEAHPLRIPKPVGESG